MYEDKLIRRAYLVQTLRDFLDKINEHEVGVTKADLDIANNEITTLMTEEKLIVPAINELWEKNLLHSKIFVTTFDDWEANHKLQDIYDRSKGGGTLVYIMDTEFDTTDDNGNLCHFYPNSMIIGTPVDGTAEISVYDWSFINNSYFIIDNIANMDAAYAAANNTTMVEYFNLLAGWINNDDLHIQELDGLKTERKQIVPAINELYDETRKMLKFWTLPSLTYWEANYKHANINPLSSKQYPPVAYQINEDFEFNGVKYKAGSWIMGEDLIMDSESAGFMTYDWFVHEDVALRVGLTEDLTTIDKTNTVAAINELDAKQGDEELTVIDTIEGKTDPEETISAAINVLDKELGENTELNANIIDKTNIAKAINSVYDQSVLTIEESLPIPTDPDYAQVLKRYKFYQDYEDDDTTKKLIGTINLARDLVVTSGITYRADGTETWPSTGEPCGLEAGKVYIKLTIANQKDPVYIDVRDLYNDYTVEEDPERIQLAISDDRIISADVVPNSLKYTEFVDDVNKELRFTGFDHQIDTEVPEHYEICSDSTYGALLVVSGAPQGNQIALATVQAINEAAGWGEHIELGMYVIHKEAVPPGTPQLTTTAQNLREAVNELDEKQGDEVLTTTAQTISGAINEHDAEIGNLDDLTTVAKDNLVNAIDELDEKQGDEVLTTTSQTLSGAVNELDEKQGDAVLTVIDTVNGETVAKTNLSDAVNVLDAEMGDINTLTVANAAGVILKEVASAINQLDLVQGDDIIVVKDASGATMTTLTSSVNALDDRLPVVVEVVPEADLNPGIKAAYKLTQGTTTPVELGLIEIPYSNYDGEATDTVTVTVDSTDGHRVITADVNDGSIGKQQLDTEVNDLLDYIGDKTIKLSDKDTLTEAINDNILALKTKMAYKETTSWLTFDATYKSTADKNDMYVIATDFTVDGVSYNAGSWALCTDVATDGTRTWRYINNGGQGTVIKPITNETEISEVRDAEGNIVVTDVIGSANVGDPAGSIYLISTEGIVKFAPHHGIYVKTADSGGTEVVEIFDFGKEGGADVYVGSEGANIKVTVDVVGTTGTIGATIVLGSLNKALMDTEINNIFNFTGYPTALTTTAQDLAGGVNEHDAELGDIINAALEIKDGTNNDVANILKAIAKNNLTWEDAITTTAATTTITATAPMKRGYVYNVTGVESTINGIACKPGDWLVVVSDTALGAQPSFLKLGSSSGGGMDDGGPFIKIN